MPRYADPSSINFSSGFSEVPSYLNEVTTGLFGIMLMISIYIITLMGVLFYKREDGAIKEAMMIAGVFSAMVGILFWVADLITGWTLTFVIVVALAGFIIWNTER